jgi:hypothetical protein
VLRTLLVSVATMMATGIPVASAAALPKVLTQEHPTFQVRPAVIAYTGDGTGIVGGPDGTSETDLGHLNWTTYNRRAGVAVGLVWLDDCTPDCASGTFNSAAVRVRVSSPTHGHFRLLTLRYTYQGKRYADRRVAQFYRGGSGVPSYWAYAICGISYAPKC